MAEQIALNIDCMEYMKTLPDNAFELVVADPPYGDAGSEFKCADKSRFGGSLTATKRGGAVERTGGTWAAKFGKKIIAWDVAPEKEYFDELFRISRNQIIWGGNYFNLPPTRCFLIWRKTNIPENFSMAMCEYAWTSFNDNSKVFDFRSDNQPNRFHPTQKPIELYAWIYRRYAKEGDKILDTHLGSGSSRIAAYDAGLDFVGCEIDKEYFDLQEKRWEDYTAQMNLFTGVQEDIWK